MARVCGKCERVLRWDELLSTLFVSGWGNGQLCERCVAEQAGAPPPPPKRYPPGCRMPQKPGPRGGDIPICGLCRVALTEDLAGGKHIRLRPEFVTEADGVEAGSYLACPECVATWRPRILAYLKRTCRTCGETDCERADHVRFLPESATERQAVGNLLC